MAARAMDGTCLAKLVKMAIPICRSAQRQCLRTGPGRAVHFPDWKIAVMILIAIISRESPNRHNTAFSMSVEGYFRRGWSSITSQPEALTLIGIAA